MGTSAFGDSSADSEWRQRTDWDIAVCGDLIRTNSGMSGTGNGGIQVVPDDYNQLQMCRKADILLTISSNDYGVTLIVRRL